MQKEHVFIDVAVSRDRNIVKKEAEASLEYRDLMIQRESMWSGKKKKNKSDNNNIRGSWNHLKIIQKILEQHTGRARNQGTL
jgi:hypothetical protein